MYEILTYIKLNKRIPQEIITYEHLLEYMRQYICEAFNITLAEFFTREPLQYELTEIEGAVIDSMRKCDRAGRERIKAYAEGVAGL